MKNPLRPNQLRLIRCKMRIPIVAILAITIIAVSTMASSAFASNQPSVGVQEGDWIEYSINVTGGTPPPKLSLNWFRIQILDVDGSIIQANFTTKFVNETFYSTVWKYNFTQGNTGGWTIIPPSLDVGDSFYDSFKPGNVTIEGEEQKVVAGATRTITHASDQKREIKEWDKATGIFTFAIEHPRNLTLTATAIATNIWSPQILGIDQPVFALVIGFIMFALVVLFSVAAISQTEKLRSFRRRYPLLGKRSLIAATIALIVFVGAAGLISVFWVQIGLTDAQINLIMQSLWTSLIVSSFLFRKNGNHFIHGVLMAVVVIATLISFSLVIFMSPPSGGSMESYFSSPLKIAEFVSHGILSIPAIAFGVWLVAIWRPNSTSFPVKSEKIAKITVILWVLSYLAGVLGYFADYVVLLG